MAQHLFILCVIAIVGSILGGFAWVVNRIDRVTLRMDSYVKTETCLSLRTNCPCVSKMQALQRLFDIRYLLVSLKILDIKLN